MRGVTTKGPPKTPQLLTTVRGRPNLLAKEGNTVARSARMHSRFGTKHKDSTWKGEASCPNVEVDQPVRQKDGHA